MAHLRGMLEASSAAARQEAAFAAAQRGGLQAELADAQHTMAGLQVMLEVRPCPLLHPHPRLSAGGPCVLPRQARANIFLCISALWSIENLCALHNLAFNMQWSACPSGVMAGHEATEHCLLARPSQAAQKTGDQAQAAVAAHQARVSLELEKASQVPPPPC